MGNDPRKSEKNQAEVAGHEANRRRIGGDFNRGSVWNKVNKDGIGNMLYHKVRHLNH